MYVLQADVFSAVKNGVTSREIRAAQRFHELIGNPGSTRDAADSYLLDQHAGILMQLATLFTVGPPKKQILIGAIGQLDRSYNYTLSGQDYGPLSPAYRPAYGGPSAEVHGWGDVSTWSSPPWSIPPNVAAGIKVAIS